MNTLQQISPPRVPGAGTGRPGKRESSSDDLLVFRRGRGHFCIPHRGERKQYLLTIPHIDPIYAFRNRELSVGRMQREIGELYSPNRSVFHETVHINRVQSGVRIATNAPISLRISWSGLLAFTPLERSHSLSRSKTGSQR